MTSQARSCIFSGRDATKCSSTSGGAEVSGNLSFARATAKAVWTATLAEPSTRQKEVYHLPSRGLDSLRTEGNSFLHPRTTYQMHKSLATLPHTLPIVKQWLRETCDPYPQTLVASHVLYH